MQMQIRELKVSGLESYLRLHPPSEKDRQGSTHPRTLSTAQMKLIIAMPIIPLRPHHAHHALRDLSQSIPGVAGPIASGT